jgi:hypothetical protein
MTGSSRAHAPNWKGVNRTYRFSWSLYLSQPGTSALCILLRRPRFSVMLPNDAAGVLIADCNHRAAATLMTFRLL